MHTALTTRIIGLALLSLSTLLKKLPKINRLMRTPIRLRALALAASLSALMFLPQAMKSCAGLLRSCGVRFGLLLACCGLALAPLPAGSAIVPWAGSGGSGLWSDNLNWFGGGVPALGDGVSFGAGKPHLVNTNDLITGRFWSRVDINGSNYVIRGNAMHLTNNFRADYLSGSSTFEPDLALFSRNQSLNLFQPNSTLI